MIARRDRALVLGLSLVGLIDGVYALLPIHTVPGEFTFWVLAGILWGVVVARRGVERPLVALVLVGFLAGVWTAAVEAVFWDAYVANVPSIAEAYEGVARPVAILLNLVQTAAIGAVWGALVWVFVWVARRVAVRRQASAG